MSGAAARDDAVLDLVDVGVRFGGIRALDGVSFVVQRGELLGLIGPNGAGKTTLLRSISGQVVPQHGTIRLEGRDLRGIRSAARARLGLAMSHQIVRPFRNLTLLDNVALAAGAAVTASPFSAIAHLSRARQRAEARTILERVGIADVADAFPATQPLGILKRLEVARALASRPAILMLDEPLAGLNAGEASRLADTIAAVNRDGATIVLIEHNIAEARRICSRFVVLDNGRTIADGPVGSVLADSRVVAAYLGGGRAGV